MQLAITFGLTALFVFVDSIRLYVQAHPAFLVIALYVPVTYPRSLP